MPELPEVETVRRTLAPAVGHRVREVWCSGKPLHMNRPVDVSGLEAASVGARIEGFRRLGKYLLVDFAGRPDCVLVHLGMTGRLRITPASTPRPRHTHVVFGLSRGAELRFVDARRFGQVSVARREAEREHPALARLGVDPLTSEFSGEVLYDLAHPRRTTLKSFLLDQSAIAGLGNIYVSEALWKARISPTLRAHRLSRARGTQLAVAVVDSLTHALDRGGTSLRDFVNADGVQGEYAEYLWVYGRAGEPCRHRGCTSTIRRKVIQGRATFYCPTCQRG